MSHSSFIEVPQTVYIPQTPFQPQQPVFFSTNGLCGISLADAFYGRLDALDYRNERHGIQSGMRIALRIMWPGYPEWVFRNVTVVSLGQTSTAHTMHRLVSTLAKKIHEFYTEMTSSTAPRGAIPDWALQNIDFNRLYMSELRQVSQGCWQPVLYYNVST